MHRARSSAPPRSTPIRLDLRPLEVKPQGGISGVDLKILVNSKVRADYSVQMVPHVNVQRLVLMQQHPAEEKPPSWLSSWLHSSLRRRSLGQSTSVVEGVKGTPHRLITRCECASDPEKWAHSSSSARDNTVGCASCREVGRAHRLCTPRR